MSLNEARLSSLQEKLEEKAKLDAEIADLEGDKEEKVSSPKKKRKAPKK